MEGQSQSRPMALAFGAVAAIGACVVLAATSTAQPTSLYTVASTGVSVVRPPVALSQSAAMGPHMGRPAMAAMPTSEVDMAASASTPIAQVPNLSLVPMCFLSRHAATQPKPLVVNTKVSPFVCLCTLFAFRRTSASRP